MFGLEASPITKHAQEMKTNQPKTVLTKRKAEVKLEDLVNRQVKRRKVTPGVLDTIRPLDLNLVYTRIPGEVGAKSPSLDDSQAVYLECLTSGDKFWACPAEGALTSLANDDSANVAAKVMNHSATAAARKYTQEEQERMDDERVLKTIHARESTAEPVDEPYDGIVVPSNTPCPEYFEEFRMLGIEARDATPEPDYEISMLIAINGSQTTDAIHKLMTDVVDDIIAENEEFEYEDSDEYSYVDGDC